MKLPKLRIYTTVLLVTAIAAMPFMWVRFYQSKHVGEEKASADIAEPVQTTEAAPVIEPVPEVQPMPQTQPVPGVQPTPPAQPVPQTQPPQAAESTAPPETVTEPLTTAQPLPAFVQAPEGYFDDALFIGDSRMVGIYKYGGFDTSEFFCTGGLSAHDIMDDEEIEGITLQEHLAQKPFGKIYVSLGMNDVVYGVEEYREKMQGVYDLIRAAQPDAYIYLMANLHVSIICDTNQPKLSNERLNEANQFMAELADGQTSFYIDQNFLFDDEEGRLKEELGGDKGIHPGGTEYAQWADFIRSQTIPR